jgi:hypothetical protein
MGRLPVAQLLCNPDDVCQDGDAGDPCTFSNDRAAGLSCPLGGGACE